MATTLDLLVEYDVRDRKFLGSRVLTLNVIEYDLRLP